MNKRRMASEEIHHFEESKRLAIAVNLCEWRIKNGWSTDIFPLDIG